MRTQSEIEEQLRINVEFEAKSAAEYHELRVALATHNQPWYEQAKQAAERSYFRIKASRLNLEWVLGLPPAEESHAYWTGSDEPPLPENWPTEFNEKWNTWASQEKYRPWRHLVYEFNNSAEQAGCAPLTCNAFYERCRQSAAFQARWTPYADLNNTPFGPISDYELKEGSGHPLS